MIQTPKAIAYCDGCRQKFGLFAAHHRAEVACSLCKSQRPCNILIDRAIPEQDPVVQRLIEELRGPAGDLPMENAVPVKAAPPSTSKRPQEPGMYFWYILDLSYFSVGAVQVLKDSEKHLEYLRGLVKDGKDTRQFHLYQNDVGEWLTMYHQAIDARPECDATGNPYVDGYRPFNLDTFLGPRPFAGYEPKTDKAGQTVGMQPNNPSGIMHADFK